MQRISSALEEYSTIVDEREKEKRNIGNIQLQMVRPKTEYINNIVGEYLVSKGYEDTFNMLSREDGMEMGPNKDARCFIDSTQQEMWDLMRYFNNGQEKEFFKLRDKFYEDLNYYKIDFEYDHYHELNQRAYFTVYPLIPMFRKYSFEEAWRQAKERSESFKRYITENGAHFINDEKCRSYLKLPYLIQNMKKDDELLERILTDEFAFRMSTETEEYMKKVCTYISRTSYNKSILHRALDYNIKHNDVYNNKKVDSVYRSIATGAEKYKKYSEDISKRIEEIDDTHEILNQRYNSLKEQYLSEYDRVHHKSFPEHIEPGKVVYERVVSNDDIRYTNWVYSEMMNKMIDARKKFKPTKNDDDKDILMNRLMHFTYLKIKHDARKPI